MEDDDAQALRQLELCLRVHAKIASGVHPSPPPGTLSGLVRSVTSGSMSRADGRSDVSRGGVSSRVSAIVDGIEASGVAGSCARVSGPDAGVAPPVRCLGSEVRVRAPCPAAENTFAYNKCDLEEGFDTPLAKASERGYIGLLEVIESDFSSRSAHFKSLRNSSGVSSHADCSLLAFALCSCLCTCCLHACYSLCTFICCCSFVHAGW